jgi:heparan-sulfate lyase
MTIRTLACSFLLACVAAPGWVRADDAAAVRSEVAASSAAWPKPLPADDPRFGILRVLSLLNLDHPGLEQVKAAAAAESHEKAGLLLLDYFRATRSAGAASPAALDPTQRRHADDALGHRFRGNGEVFPPVFRGARIDWTGRAFADGKEIHDAEWYFQFQRLTWWPALARTYSSTRDEAYFHEWRYEMVGWAVDLLPFTKATPDFVKRGMETYGRCDRMIEVLPIMIQSRNFDAKTLLYFLASFHDQADHITRGYAKTGNHRLGELTQVFRNGCRFPEFKRAEAWRNDGITLLPRMMDDTVYEDGMNRELVFSYHGMYVGLFMEAWRMFREHGCEDRLPPSFKQKLLKMAEIYAMQSFPDFTICQFGDAWKQRDPGGLFRKDLAPLAAEIPYAAYLASGGKQGPPPGRTCAAYPVSGFYFFRSEWSRDATFMPVKCGGPAAWHNQPDNGTFELYALGRNLMTDSGCYVYGSSDPEDQRWREWFGSTKVHQTLTLDQRNLTCEPRFVIWSETDGLAALVVENQSYPGLKHRRTVLFIDRSYFLIHDEAIGEAAGDVRIHFQFAPCEAEIAGLTATTRFAEGANLMVKTFPLAGPVSTEQEEGWVAYAIRRKEPRPAWSWKVSKQANDRQAGFLTALVPFMAGRMPATVEASVTNDRGTRVFRARVGDRNRQIRVDPQAGKASITDSP